MGKIIFWLVVVFAVLLVLRLINAGKARARDAAAREAARGTGSGKAGTTAMVRCVGCGVFLPRAEARALPDGFHCGNADCAQHRTRGN
jgi:hypothetical protein